MIGKGAMVWRLREWQDGDPVAQAAQAVSLGLSHVSLKIIDGTQEKWERWYIKRQNYELLSDTIAALREAGIGVKAWGWTYGNKPKAEAEKTIELCRKYGISEYDIDAEHQYNKIGMADAAEIYSQTLASAEPEIRVGLCSYRFPRTHQPSFPMDVFAPFMDYWCPQVYFLGDNRLTGGASQLEVSSEQYDAIRKLPYVGVAPTYLYIWKDSKGIKRTWRASKDQLTLFFTKAKMLGHEGFMVWDLPQASQEQLDAIKEFIWIMPEPPPTNGTAEALRDEAALLQSSANRLVTIADNLE